MMLAVAALAAVVAAPSAERTALAARWERAAPTSIPANRLLREGAVPPASTLASLPALARAELGVPGRYRFAAAEAPPANPTWWQRFVQWMRDRWNALWRLLAGRISLSPRAGAAIADAMIALLLLIVVAAILRLFVFYQHRRSAVMVRALTERADAQALYAQALTSAERGEYAAAARWLFRAMLALLDLRGSVRDDLSATVGELRRRLRDREGTSVPAFDAVASAFVAGTYAERPLDAAQWERARKAYADLARETPA